MYSPGVIEHVDVLEYEHVCMADVPDVEAVQPFPLDECME